MPNFAKLSSEITVTEAASRIGKHPQTVRNWISEGRLSARQASNRRWYVTTASLLPFVVEIDGAEPKSTLQTGDSLAAVLAALDELRERDRAAERLLIGIEAERDRYRAEAVAFRSAALELVAAASETDAGVRHLLAVLAQQKNALGQLLTPGTVADHAS